MTKIHFNGQTYREYVLGNCPNFSQMNMTVKLSLGGLGISGEAGEVADEIKKIIHHDKTIDRDKLIKELGDVRWYLEFMSAVLDISMEEIEERNIKKLLARYPEGFSVEAANAPRKDS